MLSHCNRTFKPLDTWFLFDTSLFFDRRLEVYRCPICDKDLCRLIEVRKTDNRIFDRLFKNQEARNKIKELTSDINYTTLSLRVEKGEPTGFIYGENKEIKRNGIIQDIKRACDFFGNKKIISKKEVLNQTSY